MSTPRNHALELVQHVQSHVSAQTTGSLTIEVDDDILRGVSVATMLQNGGRVFRWKEFGSQKGYLLSQRVLRLGAFISHDWASGWLSKYLALCLVYNGNAAVLASLIATVLTGVLQIHNIRLLPKQEGFAIFITEGLEFDYTPDGWCSLLSLVVFMYFFCFWHGVRELLGLQAGAVFLDKCCVDQIDEERKTRAINGLAGFLASSDKLVILWSPRYFTRLWCTYEVASWLHLGKEAKSIIFVPLALSSFIAITSLALAVIICVVSFTVPERNVAVTLRYLISNEKPHTSGADMLVLELTFMILIRKARQQFRELVELPKLLKAFAVENAQCFCCSSGHVDPETGRELPCDRALVYKTLGTWFAGQEARDELQVNEIADGLITFNTMVRDQVGQDFLSRVGSARLPYSYLLFMFCPFLWYGITQAIVGLQALPTHMRYRTGCFYCVYSLAHFPIVSKAILYVVVASIKLEGYWNTRWWNELLSILSATACSGIVIFMNDLFLQTHLPFVAFIWFPLAFVLYRPDRDNTLAFM